MTNKFNLFRKHYNKKSNNLKTNTFRSYVALKKAVIEEDLNYDDYGDTLYLNQDIDYDVCYDDMPFDNKKASVDYFYNIDDYDYIE